MTNSGVSGPAARAEDLVKRYGSGPAAVTALAGVSVEIPAGSFTAVMGPSGSGKSTLLHCMAGLDSPDSGRVWMGGEEITAMPDRQLTRLRRDRVGFVFQAFNLLPVLPAASNITLPVDIAGRDPDRVWPATVVETVGLAGRLSHRPAELSGGQQACARVGAWQAPGLQLGREATGCIHTILRSDAFAFPTAVAVRGGRLLVVNSQLNQMGGHPRLPFTVLALAIPETW